jgi:uncharacterized protein YjiS (DUF1127 family)
MENAMKHLKITSLPPACSPAGGPALGEHWHQPLPSGEEVSASRALADAFAAGRELVRDWARRALATLALWVERDRSRRELAELSERALHDVSLTAADVWRESTKPFWRA